MAVLEPTTLDYDSELLDRELQEDSARLFLEDHDSFIRVNEGSDDPLLLHGTKPLLDYLENSASYEGTRLISVPQRGSADSLAISNTGYGALFSTLGNFAPLHDMVRAFGVKVKHDANRIPPYQEHLNTVANKRYCSFVVRYAVEHGREEVTNPWTVRKMGVFLVSTGTQTSIVLINPAKRVARRFQDAQKRALLGAADVLSLACSTAFHRWPAYLDYLESSCNQLQMKASAHSLGVSGDSHFRLNLDLSMADLENLQQIRRDLRGAARDLQLDLNVSNAIEKLGTVRTPSWSRSGIVAHLENELDRNKSLITSLDDTAGLVRTFLELHQSDKASEMARLAAVDTFVMRELSRKAQRDSHTLKVLTILAMLYLPASFVSTLLSMGYIHIAKTPPHVLHVDPEFLIFVVLTICFLCITIGVWLGFELRAQRLDRCESAHRNDGHEKASQEVGDNCP